MEKIHKKPRQIAQKQRRAMHLAVYHNNPHLWCIEIEPDDLPQYEVLWPPQITEHEYYRPRKKNLNDGRGRQAKGYFAQNHKEIAEQIGITKSRVHQIEAKALRKLRIPIRRALISQFVEEPDIDKMLSDYRMQVAEKKRLNDEGVEVRAHLSGGVFLVKCPSCNRVQALDKNAPKFEAHKYKGTENLCVYSYRRLEENPYIKYDYGRTPFGSRSVLIKTIKPPQKGFNHDMES